MTTLADLRKRLARLEANTGRKVVTFKMLDGSYREMSSSRLLEVFQEGLADEGVKGRDYETVVTNVANNADHRLVDLFKMCVE